MRLRKLTDLQWRVLLRIYDRRSPHGPRATEHGRKQGAIRAAESRAISRLHRLKLTCTRFAEDEGYDPSYPTITQLTPAGVAQARRHREPRR